MALDIDVKKILCDRKVASLANFIADQIEKDPSVFSDGQKENMTRLDKQWYTATESIIGADEDD